jgi:hypothetical protein
MIAPSHRAGSYQQPLTSQKPHQDQPIAGFSLTLFDPLVALPFLNSAQVAHPAFGRSVKELREAGVVVLLGPEGYEPHAPHPGSKYLASYPWHVVLAAVETTAKA